MMVEIGNNIKRGNYIPYRWCKVVYNHLKDLMPDNAKWVK